MWTIRPTLKSSGWESWEFAKDSRVSDVETSGRALYATTWLGKQPVTEQGFVMPPGPTRRLSARRERELVLWNKNVKSDVWKRETNHVVADGSSKDVPKTGESIENLRARLGRRPISLTQIWSGI